MWKKWKSQKFENRKSGNVLKLKYGNVEMWQIRKVKSRK